MKNSNIIMISLMLLLLSCASGVKLSEKKLSKIKIGSPASDLYIHLGLPSFQNEDQSSYNVCNPLGKKKHIQYFHYTYAQSIIAGGKSSSASFVVNKKTAKVCKIIKSQDGKITN